MKNVHHHVVLPAVLAGLLSACATAPVPPRAPAALNPPAGQSLVVEALAQGVQIYQCDQKPNGSYEWIFKAPEATLATRDKHVLGKHYAGPTWEAVDGSTVVGQVAAKDPGPDASAIPWLLLTAKSNTGSGMFSRIKSVQRLYTTGGLAPTDACNAANLKTFARTPYTATYYFYQ